MASSHHEYTHIVEGRWHERLTHHALQVYVASLQGQELVQLVQGPHPSRYNVVFNFISEDMDARQ